MGGTEGATVTIAQYPHIQPIIHDVDSSGPFGGDNTDEKVILIIFPKIFIIFITKNATIQLEIPISLLHFSLLKLQPPMTRPHCTCLRNYCCHLQIL